MSKANVIAGKPVVDAKKPVILEITAHDLRVGKKRRPDCCVAAEACKRQFGVKRAIAQLSRIYIEEPKRWIRYVTPGGLRNEIISFDRGNNWSGVGEYRLAPFNPSNRLGVKKHKKTKNPGSVPQRANRLRHYNKLLGVRHKAKLSSYV